MRFSWIANLILIAFFVVGSHSIANAYDLTFHGQVTGLYQGLPVPNQLIEIESIDPGYPLYVSTQSNITGHYSITVQFVNGAIVPMRISTQDPCTEGKTYEKQVNAFELAGSIHVPFYVCDSLLNLDCEADFSYLLDPLLSGTPNEITAVFSDSSTTQVGSIVSWNWTFSNGNGSLLQNPSTNYQTYPAAIYNVCLTISTDSGCIDTQCLPLTIADTVGNTSACEADFIVQQNASNPLFPEFNHYTFSNISTSSGTIISYIWDFDDGTISTDQNPSHIYYNLIPDTFNVCLLIFTSDTCSSSKCQKVIIEDSIPPPACQAYYSYVADSIANFGFVFSQLSSSADPIISYEWDFGDGTVSFQPDPSHQFPGMGVYDVCLMITTMDSCESTYCETVYVDTIPPIDCIANFEYGIAGTANQDHFFDLSESPGATVTHWIWDFGDGSYSQDQNPIHGFQLTGYYNVCLTIYTDKWCSSTYCNTIYYDASIQYCETNYNYLYNNPASFMDLSFYDASLSSTIGWFWNFGDGANSAMQNPNHIYTVPGIYEVCLETTNSDSCVSSHCKWIQVDDSLSSSACQASFVYGGIVGVFEPGHFNDQSFTTGNITDWYWDFGDGTSSVSQNPLHYFSMTGSYNVCLTITTDDSCSSSFCDTIYFEITTPICEAFFNAIDKSTILTPYCYLFEDASAASNTITGWNWSFGDNNSDIFQHPDHCYSELGTYNVCLDIITIDGCTSSYCKQLKVNPPDSLFDVSGFVFGKSSVLANTSVLLLSNSGDIYSTSTDINGFYIFKDILMDTFIIYSVPDQFDYPNYAPSYHPNMLFWENATELIVNEDKYNQNIHLKSFTEPVIGPGVISGGISWINSISTNTYQDRTNPSPEDITVLLLNLQNELLECARSNVNGSFIFNDLPYGIYKLDLELTGYMTYTVIITLSAADPVSDGTQFTIEDGVAYIGVEEGIGEQQDAFYLYPNPVQNQLFIQMPASVRSKPTISILNTLGQQIDNIPYKRRSESLIYMNVAQLPSGIYFLAIDDEENAKEIIKFVK